MKLSNDLTLKKDKKKKKEKHMISPWKKKKKKRQKEEGKKERKEEKKKKKEEEEKKEAKKEEKRKREKTYDLTLKGLDSFDSSLSLLSFSKPSCCDKKAPFNSLPKIFTFLSFVNSFQRCQ